MKMESTKVRNSRKRGESRQWKPAESQAILNHMLDLKISGKDPGHPTANKYYQKIIDNLKIPSCNVKQISSKVTNLKKKYSLAIQWANKTGQGVENGSILDHQRKICPFFDILDNIFGEKKSFRVPNLHCNIQHKKPNEHSDQSDGIDEEQNNRTVNVNDNCVDVQNYDEWDINVIFDENLIDNVEQQNVNEAELPEKESSEGESIQQNELIQDVNVQSGGDDMCVEITEDTIVPSNSRKRSHVDDHVNPVLFGDSKFLEEEDDMIREILDDDDNQTTAGATSRNKTTSEDRVSRFRKCLSTPHSTSGFKATDNRQDRNATTLIGDALTKRATVMEDRNSQEFEIRKQEIEFEREKFDFEKEMRRKEMDFSHRLQDQKLRQEGRLAELKLKYEFERR